MVIETFLAFHLISAMMHGPPLRENIVEDNKQYRCLLRAVWHESRGEGFRGQLWTAKTILNRTRSEGFPPSVCKVVYQKNQFSFTHQLPINKQYVNPKTALEKQTFKQVELASTIAVLADRLSIDYTNDSKYYHTLTVKPVWRHKLKITKVIGNHIFYKEKI